MFRLLVLLPGLTAICIYLSFTFIYADNIEKLGLRRLGSDLTSIFFVGDLHGDVHCARAWVERTHLVNLTSTPWTWTGSNSDAIVFLGDYVDKGSKSRAVLEFIRTLEEMFPTHIVAIMGNHDLYMLIDTMMHPQSHSYPMGQPVHDFTYSFVHPEEYMESGWSPSRPDDDDIMAALHKALQHVYDNELHGSMFICTAENSKCSDPQDDVFQRSPLFRKNPDLALRVKERVNLWRKEYAQGLVDSGLIHWLSTRPIVAVVGDALVVHGGVPINVINFLISNVDSKMKPASVDDVLHHTVNSQLHQFWDSYGEAIDKAFSLNYTIPELPLQIAVELVNYRGYFHQQRGCREVSNVLNAFESIGLNRIVVGHTPHSTSHEKCSGHLLAADSSLSRSFRAYGNFYCPIDGKFRDDNILQDFQLGDDCIMPMNDQCEGSIRRISRKSTDGVWETKSEEIFMTSTNRESDSSRTGDEL